MITVPLIISCASAPVLESSVAVASESSARTVDQLIQRAESLSGEDSARLRLQAVTDLEQAGDLRSALDQSLRVETESIGEPLRTQTLLIQADLALRLQMPTQSLDTLATLSADAVAAFPEQLSRYYELSGLTYLALGDGRLAATRLTQAADAAAGDPSQALHDNIWRALSGLDSEQLAEFANAAESYSLRGWIELARIYWADQFSIRSQLNAIDRWRNSWNQHPAMELMPQSIANLALTWEARPRQIALILPLQQSAGVAIQEGFLSAYYRSLEISTEVPRLDVYDSSGLNTIMSVYQEAVDAGAELIIGPLNKVLVNELHRQDSLPVPTLALNYSDAIDLGPENLWQFGLAPEDEINQTTELAWDSGYRNAAVLTPDTPDYLQLQEEFEASWTARGGRVVSRTGFANSTDYSEVVRRLLAIDSSEARAARLLNLLPRNDLDFIPRRRRDIDFLFLIANPRQGRQIKPTLDFYFAQELPVFALPSINDGLNNPDANGDLNDIMFTDAPWILAPEGEFKQAVESSLRTTQGALQRLRAMGIDSFMLYTRLAQFRSGELSGLKGMTGNLQPVDNQTIHRRLQFARFSDGVVEVVSVAAEPNND